MSDSRRDSWLSKLLGNHETGANKLTPECLKLYDEQWTKTYLNNLAKAIKEVYPDEKQPNTNPKWVEIIDVGKDHSIKLLVNKETNKSICLEDYPLHRALVIDNVRYTLNNDELIYSKLKEFLIGKGSNYLCIDNGVFKALTIPTSSKKKKE